MNCGASTSTDSPSYPFPHDLGPKSTLIESQAVQVNLPNKGVDFGIQVNLRGLHLMMKSTDTQVEVDVSESSTQTEEVFLPEIEDNKEEATEAAASPEVSPRKDGIYLPTKQEDSDDSNMSGSDNEHQREIKYEKPRDDTKYIVFKEELFKS